MLHFKCWKEQCADDTWDVASCIFVLGSILHIYLNKIWCAIYFILADNVYLAVKFSCEVCAEKKSP